MNFKYNFFEWRNSLIAHIEPNPNIKGDYELLETALDSDIDDYEKVIEYISDIMSGKSEESYIDGDITSILCNKAKTLITWEAGKNDAKCELPTWLFKEIVEVWIKAIKEYKSKKLNK